VNCSLLHHFRDDIFHLYLTIPSIIIQYYNFQAVSDPIHFVSPGRRATSRMSPWASNSH